MARPVPPAGRRSRGRIRAVDGAHAELFTGNAREYSKTLTDLTERFDEGLASCDRRPVVVTAHDAFGRLASRWKLEQVPIAGISPDAEPDPRHLAEVADLVRDEGITTIFTEELVSPAVANALAREAGVNTAVLDPIESLDDGDTYVAAMDRNLEVLRRALGCK